MLHVGVNLAYLRPGRVGGSEVYVRELLCRLSDQPGVRVTGFCWAGAMPALGSVSGVHLEPLFSGPYRVWRRLLAETAPLALLAAKAGIQVLFSPANIAAIALPLGVPQVVTVHDLQHIHLPENFTPATRMARSALMRASLLRCHKAVAISDFTRGDCIKHLGVAGDHITTILQGSPEGIAAAAPPQIDVLERYAIPREYVVYPAMAAPHKNHDVLFQAMARMPGQRPLSLVLLGFVPEAREGLLAMAAARGVASRVLALGHIPRQDALDVIALARVLAFPSRFEGFGLPILEAMRFGVPVVASAAASIPEVAGRGALLVNPTDVDGWARALLLAANDSGVRHLLIEAGRTNLARFSWDRCARETLGVLSEAAASGRKAP